MKQQKLTDVKAFRLEHQAGFRRGSKRTAKKMASGILCEVPAQLNKVGHKVEMTMEFLDNISKTKGWSRPKNNDLLGSEFINQGYICKVIGK